MHASVARCVRTLFRRCSVAVPDVENRTGRLMISKRALFFSGSCCLDSRTEVLHIHPVQHETSTLGSTLIIYDYSGTPEISAKHQSKHETETRGESGSFRCVSISVVVVCMRKPSPVTGGVSQLFVSDQLGQSFIRSSLQEYTVCNGCFTFGTFTTLYQEHGFCRRCLLLAHSRGVQISRIKGGYNKIKR